MWWSGPYAQACSIKPTQEATMYRTIDAAVANARHADLVARAESYRQAADARAARSTKLRPIQSSSRRSRAVRRPVGAFYKWLAAGQL